MRQVVWPLLLVGLAGCQAMRDAFSSRAGEAARAGSQLCRLPSLRRASRAPRAPIERALLYAATYPKQMIEPHSCLLSLVGVETIGSVHVNRLLSLPCRLRQGRES